MSPEQFAHLIDYLAELIGEGTTRGFTMGLATAVLHPEWAAAVYAAYREFIPDAGQKSVAGAATIVTQNPVSTESAR